MNKLTTKLQPATTSNSIFETDAFNPALILVGLGAAAVALHMVLRLPLHLPGRHGLEWLALLLLARQMSPLRGAATLTGASAAGLMLLFNPMTAPTYLVTAVLVDLGWMLFPSWRRHALLLGLLAGLAFASQPLLQLGLEPFPLTELGYRLATHFAFGAVGGIVGAGLWGMRNRLRQR